MNRAELAECLIGIMEEPLNEAILALERRLSPQAMGYKEFPDMKGMPYHRTPEEWATVTTTPEQQAAYLTRYKALHDVLAFTRGLQHIDGDMPADIARQGLLKRLGAVDFCDHLDPVADKEIIERLGTAIEQARKAINDVFPAPEPGKGAVR